MAEIVLNEMTKAAIGRLTKEEVYAPHNFPFAHELLWYGVEAVAHVHLMHKAFHVAHGKIPAEEFVERYKLRFGGATNGIEVSVDALEADGMYFPPQARPKMPEMGLKIFHSDHFNRVMQDSWTNKAYARILITRSWSPESFQSQMIVEDGMKFGRAMWDTCIDGFERMSDAPDLYSPAGAESRESQSPKLTVLGQQLSAYYSDYIKALNGQEK